MGSILKENNLPRSLGGTFSPYVRVFRYMGILFLSLILGHFGMTLGVAFYMTVCVALNVTFGVALNVKFDMALGVYQRNTWRERCLACTKK